MRNITKYIAISLGLSSQPCLAGADVAGKISALQTYYTHNGTLVQLEGSMINPDGCAATAWYIYPDSAPRAPFGQSMLLTTFSAGKSMTLSLEGCFEGYPKIIVMRVN